MKLKLTAEQVAQIRQQHQYGRRPSVIAKEFGISVQYVWLIVNGRVWKDEAPISEEAERYKKLQKSVGSAVSYAVKKGVLPNLKEQVVACVDCGKARATQYEHRDYNKPLEVEPVCASCNRARPRATC